MRIIMSAPRSSRTWRGHSHPAGCFHDAVLEGPTPRRGSGPCACEPISARFPVEVNMPATVKSVNPATESVLAEFPVHGGADVEAALEAASRAYRSWRGRTFAERAELMLRAAKYLRGEKARFAGVVTAEMGKPIT